MSAITCPLHQAGRDPATWAAQADRRVHRCCIPRGLPPAAQNISYKTSQVGIGCASQPRHIGLIMARRSARGGAEAVFRSFYSAACAPISTVPRRLTSPLLNVVLNIHPKGRLERSGGTGGRGRVDRRPTPRPRAPSSFRWADPKRVDVEPGCRWSYGGLDGRHLHDDVSIFACSNVLRVHDLADWVSVEAEGG